jgi:hypothetical protein
MATSATIEDQAPPNDGSEAVETHPEEVPSSDEVPTYGERNRDLPDQLKQALTNALKDLGKQEMFDRRREVMRDRRNRYYRRGFQHIYEQRGGGFAVGVAGETITTANGSFECSQYIGDYNIYRPTLMVIESVLTQNPPGIDFRPKTQITEDLEAANTAETYRLYFDRSNNVKGIQLDICEMMGNSGRTIVWVRTEANKQLWGVNDEGEARQMEVCTVHGTLESRVVPLTAKSQDDLLATILFDDPPVKVAKREYPHIEQKIKSSASGICENAYERIARLGVLQGTRRYSQVGEALSHLVTRVNGFLRPANFTGDAYDDPFEEATEDDVNEDGETMTVREKLDQLFPDGCHCVYLGDVYAESWNESMDDAIAIGFPYAGDGMAREAMMDDAIVIQDDFNDSMNAMREATDLGWPRTYINCEDDEFDAIQDQKSEPYAFSPMKARTGMPLAQNFFREPDLVLPDSVVKRLEYLAGPFLQFVLGTPPALFGGGMEDQKTANGYAQARAQAMGVKGIPWMNVQWLMARMYYMAALCASKNPDHSEEILVPSKQGGAKSLKLERLRKGHFGCFPDEDSSFPESTAAKRALLQQLLSVAAMNPDVALQLLGNPYNWEIFKQVFGFSEMQMQEATSAAKQMREIELLLDQQPLPPGPDELQAFQLQQTEMLKQHAAAALVAQSQGMPEPPAPPPPVMVDFNGVQYPEALLQPSIPVDELDYHQYEGTAGQNWLSTEACWRELQVGRPDTTGEILPNPLGVLNVKLHTKAHLALVPPPPTTAPMTTKPPQPGAQPPIGAPPGPIGTATM